jgi:hypothetical protein
MAKTTISLVRRLYLTPDTQAIQHRCGPAPRPAPDERLSGFGPISSASVQFRTRDSEPPRQDAASPIARASGRFGAEAVRRNLPDTTPEQKLRHRQRSRRAPAGVLRRHLPRRVGI